MFIDERKREHPCSLVSVRLSARLLMNRISPKENRKRKKKVKVAHLVKLSLNMYVIICDLVPFS